MDCIITFFFTWPKISVMQTGNRDSWKTVCYTWWEHKYDYADEYKKIDEGRDTFVFWNQAHIIQYLLWRFVCLFANVALS